MRMWKLPVRHLCRRHLLGEHNEMHMLVGSINKGLSVQGYVDKGLVELPHIEERHEELAAEMLRRGYNHKSPLPALSRAPKCVGEGKIDVDFNLNDLTNRCATCRINFRGEGVSI